jgi:hypothetical protein
MLLGPTPCRRTGPPDIRKPAAILPKMDFEFGHQVPAPPEEVADVLLDKKFQSSLSHLGALSERKVLSQKKDADGRVVRRIRCVLNLNISGVAEKFLGDSDPAWVEEATWHPDEMLWTWEVQPEVAADLLEASGEIELKASGKGTKRIVAGKVKVKVPIYGGKVEGWVIAGLKEAYAEEAEHLTEWLGG